MLLGLGCGCNCPHEDGTGTGTGTGTGSDTGTGTGDFIVTCPYCTGTDGIYEHWRLTLSGITNNTCIQCGNFNGTWILSWRDMVAPGNENRNCWWEIQTNVCLDTGQPVAGDNYTGKFVMYKPTTGPWWYVAISLNINGGFGATWRKDVNLWNCNGPNTLDLVITTGTKACANLPLTVTIEPVHPVP